MYSVGSKASVIHIQTVDTEEYILYGKEIFHIPTQVKY